MRILYITSSIYPGENAYSTRIDGICKALTLSGNDVTVVTDYSSEFYGERVIDGIRIITCAKHRHSERTLMDKVLAAKRMHLSLKATLKTGKYDCAIMGAMYMRFSFISRVLKDKDIPIVLECCEWFDTYNWRNGVNSIEYKLFNKAWGKDFLQVDGVISISRLIQEYYEENGLKVLRVPTIMDVNILIPSNSDCRNSDLRLIFVGSVSWGKDRVSDIIKAIYKIQNSRIHLDIYGPSQADVIAQLGDDGYMLEKLRDVVNIHGRIPHSVVADKCRDSDYGIIIRPNRRQSNAGFPTKLAEYMSVGTPVIANDTGDIGLYLKDNYNGVLLSRDFTQEELEERLKKLLNRSASERIIERKNARKTAEQYFDISQMKESINTFLEDIVKEKKHV